MCVDKFHFRTHRGQWCLENCDPHKILAENGYADANTEVTSITFVNS